MIHIKYTNLVYYVQDGKVVDCCIADDISYSSLLTYVNQYNKKLNSSRKMLIRLIPENSLEGYLIEQLNNSNTNKIRHFNLAKHLKDVHEEDTAHAY